MSSPSIVSRFSHLWPPFGRTGDAETALNLSALYHHPALLPAPLGQARSVQECLQLLGPLAWDQFPERDLQRNWGQASTPYAAFAAACLWHLQQHLGTLTHLHRYLGEQPELAWVLGFRAAQACRKAEGHGSPCLPDPRHFPRLLHKMPNACGQFLLASSVTQLLAESQRHGMAPPQVVAVDTKHILAWVRENNPKTYVAQERYNKAKQPAGDPDCKLGCKRRHNRRASSKEPPASTPMTNPVPAATISIGEYYWGYASGVAAMRLPEGVNLSLLN